MDLKCSHSSCVLSSIRGFSRGVTYGAKVRFTHSIVMAVLFGRGPWSTRIRTILKNTYEHCRRLGLYVFLYKSVQCILTRVFGCKRPAHSFVAGGVAGYLIFTEESPINSQITLYLFSRVTTALMSLLHRRRWLPRTWLADQSFLLMTTTCWALVMYLFEKKREVLQNSLTRSMVELYDDSDKWTGYIDFLPYSDTIKSYLK